MSTSYKKLEHRHYSFDTITKLLQLSLGCVIVMIIFLFVVATMIPEDGTWADIHKKWQFYIALLLFTGAILSLSIAGGSMFIQFKEYMINEYMTEES